MAKKAFLKKLNRLDGYSRVITGKPLYELIGEVFHMLAADTMEKKREQPAQVPLAAEYAILGADPDWDDRVIRSLYRKRARELHPDTGVKPDAELFAATDEAYKKIMNSRKKASAQNPQTGSA